MSLLNVDAKLTLNKLKGDKLAKLPDADILGILKIPTFGPSKCSKVMDVYGCIERLVHTPSALVHGLEGMGDGSKITLKRYLDDPETRDVLCRLIKRRGHPAVNVLDFKSKLNFRNMLAYILNDRIRGPSVDLIQERWAVGWGLVESITKRTLLGRIISDKLHWQLVYAMNTPGSKAIAESIDGYRKVFHTL